MRHEKSKVRYLGGVGLGRESDVQSESGNKREKEKDGQTPNCALGMFWLCVSAPISLDLVESQSSETFSMCVSISTGGLAHTISISNCGSLILKNEPLKNPSFSISCFLNE